ncbi:hypothetical protein POVWA1_038450 [Plasmodium ovale wallikeri]|uniref:Uncharacterized protein n=1 Tax=Plasmodium ovale wallikeri TaxID=864142 RepID=A0A1A8Z447_PLAOA|nr:hypothetical protein POVWA1_038450 [Plasmodium ovale wallikeri]
MHRVLACQRMSQDISKKEGTCSTRNAFCSIIGVILHSSPPPILPSLVKRLPFLVNFSTATTGRRNYILSVGSS